jgi:hypothetical protein
VEQITDTFRIPRYLLARLAVEEYVRQFWWFVIIVPLFGIVALIWGSGILQAIGMFAVLWPVTIPARAVLGGWKAGTFFSDGVKLAADEDALYFAGQKGKGMKLSLSSVRKVAERHGFLVIRFGIGDFVAIPTEALSEHRQRLDDLLAGAVGAHGG